MQTTLYIKKRFVSGLLNGLSAVDSMPFPSVERAAKWAAEHKAKPVKPANRRGSSYLVEDASFQSFAR